MATVQKLAVLVGCNYPGTPYELTGCIDDVKAMRALLIGRLGFTLENITILTDERSPEPRNWPLLIKIIEALLEMFGKAKEGDILFFYFSGNGTLFTPPAEKKNDNNVRIPAIVSSDLLALTAADILRLLPLVPDGAIFTLVSDSSFSGGLFNEDIQIEFNVPDPVPGLRLKTIPSGVIKSSPHVQERLKAVSSKLSSGSPPPSNCILIGSSNANQESVEVHHGLQPGIQPYSLQSYGAFTFNIPMLCNRPRFPPNTNWNVATLTKIILTVLGFDQNPFLSCTDEKAGQLFLGSG